MWQFHKSLLTAIGYSKLGSELIFEKFCKQWDSGCIVCCASARDAILLPCAHQVVCSECAARITRPAGALLSAAQSRCPVCRLHIQRVLHVTLEPYISSRGAGRWKRAPGVSLKMTLHTRVLYTSQQGPCIPVGICTLNTSSSSSSAALDRTRLHSAATLLTLQHAEFEEWDCYSYRIRRFGMTLHCSVGMGPRPVGGDAAVHACIRVRHCTNSCMRRRRRQPTVLPRAQHDGVLAGRDGRGLNRVAASFCNAVGSIRLLHLSGEQWQRELDSGEQWQRELDSGEQPRADTPVSE